MTLTEEMLSIEQIEHPGIYSARLKEFIKKLEKEIERAEKIIKENKNKI